MPVGIYTKTQPCYDKCMRNYEDTGILPELQRNKQEFEKNGILPNAEILMHMPSEFACTALTYVTYAAYFCCDRSFRVLQREMKQYLLCYVERGSLTVVYQEQEIEVHKGELMLLDCRKAFTCQGTDDVSFRYIYFNGANSGAYLRLLSDGEGILVRPVCSVEVQSAIQSIFALIMQKKYSEHLISVHMQRILAELAEEKKRGTGIQNAAVLQAIDFMENRFSESLTIEQIATQVGLSEFYFSRLFRRCTTMSPHAYLVTLRITMARQLLAATQKSVERIAEECGFHSTTNFIRSFREHVGCTPKQYRRTTAAESTENNG